MKNGFTLVELLIVVGLVLIIGTVGTSIITSVLRSYNKAQITNEIEQNGNYVLSLMENQIRNARSVSASDCDASSGHCSTLEVTPQEGLVFTFSLADDGSVGEVRKGAEVLTNDDPTNGVDVDTNRGESYFLVEGSAPQKVTIVLRLTQPPATPDRIDYQAAATLRTTVVVRGGYE